MVISAETRAQIDTEIAKYPNKRGALLPALHLVQKQTVRRILMISWSTVCCTHG